MNILRTINYLYIDIGIRNFKIKSFKCMSFSILFKC